MEQALRVLWILRFRFHPPFAQCFAQVLLCEQLLSVGSLARRTRQQFFYEFEIWFALVVYECGVAACQAGVVLDRIVFA